MSFTCRRLPSFLWLICSQPLLAASVGSFHPTGTVREVNQVQAHFDEHIISFGDPAAKDPFEYKCTGSNPTISSHWVDTKTWVADFKEAPPAGTTCTFDLKTDLKSVAGNLASGKTHFEFDTGGPVVLRTERELTEDGVLLLRLTGEPDLKSVEAKAYFVVQGVKEKAGVKVIQGDLAKKILKSVYTRENEKKLYPLVLQSKQRFPSGAEVKFVWGKGIQTVTGIATKKDQDFKFKIPEPLTVSFNCERENKDSKCIPFASMSLNFSAAIDIAVAKEIYLEGGGKKIQPNFPENTDQTSYVQFKPPFPESTKFKVILPPNFKDGEGRPLQNQKQFPLDVATDRYPPLAKFAAKFGILEAKADPALPVTIRRIEPEVRSEITNVASATGKSGLSILGFEFTQGTESRIENFREIIYWLSRLERVDREFSLYDKDQRLRWTMDQKGKKIPYPSADMKRYIPSIPKTTTFKIPNEIKAEEVKAGATQVVGIPFKKPGFYLVEIESPDLGKALLGKEAPMYVPAASLVTNMAVHFKSGAENAMVWVTSLDEAKPVSGAVVQAIDCNGKVLWEGKTDGKGTALTDKLNRKTKFDPCENSDTASSLYLVATKGDDMSFVDANWRDGLESWRFKVPFAYEWNLEHDAAKVHGVLDRTLLRAGETVHIKLYARDPYSQGFRFPKSGSMPTKAKIVHYGSGEEYPVALNWKDNATAAMSWEIPKEAKAGGYNLVFEGESENGKPNNDVYFQVAEFRLPLMRAVLAPPKDAPIAPKSVNLQIALSYLSGGGASDQSVKVNSRVIPIHGFNFSDFEDVSFANGKVEEKKERETYDEETGEDSGQSQQNSKPKIASQTIKLDAAGTASATIDHLPSEGSFNIETEMEFRDPSGETQTAAQTIKTYPAETLVGIDPEGWAHDADDFRFKVIAVDVNGKPQAGKKIDVSLFKRSYFSHRKRLLGGFYAYESFNEVKKLKEHFCEGKTDSKGILSCSGKAPERGDLIAEAMTVDGEGRKSYTNQSMWIVDNDDWWFSGSDSDRIDLIPEKKRYEPDETATFTLHSPFKKATALVTVEREGILESFVTTVYGSNPSIKVPLKGIYAPNVFVSTLLIRGRADGAKPTALVDLGKPSLKMGLSEIKVGWREHELKVHVTSDKQTYRVREKAKVKIHVEPASGGNLEKGSEIAVAAIDEALLELTPNNSWKLLDSMMQERFYQVETSTAQMQIVGKRHFGLKAIPAGGGGGNGSTRELFDTLLFWKPDVLLDEKGNAEIEIPLNDSLTSFKIVAIAADGPGKFGTGSSSVRTTQELMVLAGIPPLAREGDKLQTLITVRNTTKEIQSIKISGNISGIKETLEPLSKDIAPESAAELGWTVTIPTDIPELNYDFQVSGSKGFSDKIRVKQKVIPVVPVRTWQATLEQIDKPFSLPVERPENAEAGRGAIRVQFAAKLAENMASVKKFMETYPFSCLEQQISRAVTLQNETLWNDSMKRLPSYLDGEGFAKYFPDMKHGDEVLTSYVLALGAASGWQIPDEQKSLMVSALERFIGGKSKTYRISDRADLELRKLNAMSALVDQNPANFKKDFLSQIKAEPNLWPTEALLNWFNILNKAPDIGQREAKVSEVANIMKARMHYEGSIIRFSTGPGDAFYWFMVSDDSNVIRLLYLVSDKPDWKEEAPRILRGLLPRQKSGHWDLTTANAWGVLALKKFSENFEKVPVTGTSTASLASKEQTLSWENISEGKSPQPIDLAAPSAGVKEDLKISHTGTGKPWALMQSLFAIRLQKPFSSGFSIQKFIEAVSQKVPGKWSRGDLARVHLVINAQAPMTWAAVFDPIPAGSTALGGGLMRESAMAQDDEKSSGSWPTFQEHTFEGLKTYYEYLRQGEFKLDYTVRLNNPGTFDLPATRVEAMYAPEMFGESPNQPWEILN